MPTAGALPPTPTPTPSPKPTPGSFLTTAGPATTIVGEYLLTGGRLLVKFTRPRHTGWAIVLPGAQVGQEPLTLGGEVRDTLTIRPPEPSTGAEAAVAAQQLSASGWTQDVQLALLELVGHGTPPATAIQQVEPQRSSAAAAGDPNPDGDYFENGCAYDQLDDNGVSARGCYRRYWGYEDEDDKYAGATSWAYAGIDENPGQSTVLTIVTTAHTYSNATMRQYDPLGTISQGSCSTIGLGISAYGVNVSQSQPVCPEKLQPTIYEDGTVYGVDWRGRTSSGSRHTELVEVAHTTKVYYYPAPNPSYFGFAYHMDFRATAYCVEYDCLGDPSRTPKDIIQDVLH
ncbi:MAG: hypothetical protein QOF60_1349 [Actinomycetota bacterium]|jgi:hypothetical protein|nr:hypothetical protein [Actinomycetota bacterium]